MLNVMNHKLKQFLTMTNDGDFKWKQKGIVGGIIAVNIKAGTRDVRRHGLRCNSREKQLITDFCTDESSR
ncbi:hypothetical protein ANN_19749 [Periplaneta americana]|uniref:Uncharacterized protein n=1 Tax=Periplaneta americana TaxID=6978 RepID=A0ABQ8SAQ9_PERAM|nr:hypothetical protein ANN_19749 [Periplaneta americana]